VIRRVAFALLLLAPGCSRSDQPPPSGETTGAHVSVDVPSPQSRFRGLYTAASPDSGTIRLCEGGSLAVRDLTQGELHRAHEALGGGPETPVFVEVRAESARAPATGGVTLAVAALVRASPVGESAGCAEPPAPYLYRASGNEPFWSATVGEDSIVFEQPEEPRRLAAPITGRETSAGRRVFHAETGGSVPHRFRVTLTPGRCADSMSGAIYSFSAEAVVDERPLSGCARAGDRADAP
jgi:putative lipoprotein